jgi:4-diphosphocytidyl-2-C-methyl-D-erythritol kinase
LGGAREQWRISALSFDAMRVVAPAKINLHLRVGKVRADGFHPLLTWMCTVELFDTLTMIRRGAREAANQGGKQLPWEWFSLRTDHPDLPIDRSNLVVAVATALADTLGRDGEGPAGRRERVSAYLKKRIPLGAGLGGGSSDAAAALMALAAMWKVDWPRLRLSEFASQFGSDVPFFLHGPSSICTGRGELVRPTPPPAIARFAVLLLSGIELATPKVYGQLDAMGGSDDAAIARDEDWPGWSKLPADQLLPRLVNDLEAPAYALSPQLLELRGRAERCWNNKIVRMSGSGSTLFTLCDDEAQANELASRARAELQIDAKVVRLAPAVNVSP